MRPRLPVALRRPYVAIMADDATTSLELTIGGVHYLATLPRAATTADSVEIRYLVAFERWIVAAICAGGHPSAESFRFLRERSRLTRAELAGRVAVSPETLGDWESGSAAVPPTAWDALTSIAGAARSGPNEVPPGAVFEVR